MRWATYKALCDRPDYWSRWMLEQCVDLFEQLEEPALVAKLTRVMQGQPLDTPPDHAGGRDVAMFRLDLSKAETLQAAAAVRRAIAEGLTTPATQGRGLGGFLEAWQEYAAYRA